ncbi:MAG: PQQ-binding-like beta-propeller repeat protein, partial [Planctomycetaceae bacterium]
MTGNSSAIVRQNQPAVMLLLIAAALSSSPVHAELPEDGLARIGLTRGILVVLDVPEDGAGLLGKLANNDGLIVYFQSEDAEQVAHVRLVAEEAGLLGRQVFADAGPLRSIALADNVADAILVAPSAVGQTDDQELLRTLRPQGTALVGDRELVKPAPEGIDEWTHAYHGADNNPQSNDQFVRGNFQTQFIAEPTFSPMPEQTVAAGGRLFKAMGHIAHKANQNEMLNTLLGINAYNGTILWRRPLSEGFMVHRNTMIATEDALYMGDHESCKVIDAVSGEVRQQITIPADMTDGQTWKWMAVDGDILYALVGNPEVNVDTVRSDRRGLGHWPWGMWQGHDYNDPRTAFGYGRTLVALNRQTGELLWNYRDEEFLDARAVCMKSGRIFCYCPEKFLACVDAETGVLLWKNSDRDLLAAIGPNEKAQFYITGYATSCYMKCDDNYVFFAGPQRSQMVVASAQDGRLEWTHPVGNAQLVLREDAIYAAGPQKTDGVRLAYTNGSVLSTFPARRACTRATGCIDSIFFRANGGTVRVMTENQRATHIAPMRPPCQDGVIISNGHLYWGPWMCGCQLSLYGNIGLRPAGASVSESDLYRDALTFHADGGNVQPLGADVADWTRYRGDNSQSDVSHVDLPDGVALKWQARVSAGDLPTAPVAAGGLVFVADRCGVVRALNADGQPVWKQYTSGPVFYPPAVAKDRVFVGSADGRVYAYEAKTGRPLW